MSYNAGYIVSVFILTVIFQRNSYIAKGNPAINNIDCIYVHFVIRISSKVKSAFLERQKKISRDRNFEKLWCISDFHGVF